MSHSDRDSPLRAVVPRRARKSGRRTSAAAQAASVIGPCQRPSLEDGPLLLVAIIGEPTGRWWNTGSAVLQAAWADAGLTASSLESPAVLGFAIVRAWHFITELDGPIELAMYEQCCIAEGGRRAVVGALSHQFLAPCALEEPMPLPVRHGGSPAALGERMRCLAKDRSGPRPCLATMRSAPPTTPWTVCSHGGLPVVLLDPRLFAVVWHGICGLLWQPWWSDGSGHWI